MMEAVRAHVRGNVVGYVALFVALGGTAFAAATVDSRDVVNNSLRSADLKNQKAVKGKDVRDSTLQGVDVDDSSLGGADVADNSLGGADVDETTLEGVDAATLDGLSRTEYVFRSFVSGPATREEGLVFYGYTMVTPEAGTDYILGQVKLRTTATPQEFQVCGSTGLSDPVQYVLKIEGVRTEETVPGDGCDAAVNFGDSCDFELVAAQGTRAFGAPTLPAGTSCRLLALQAS
jgi:hypothetical protein